MSSKIKNSILVIGLVTIIAICFFAGRKSVKLPTPEAHIDNERVENPIEIEKEVIKTVKVPMYITDSQRDTVFIVQHDTVFLVQYDTVFIKVPVNIEQRVYGDSLFRAVVSGPTIGDLHPTLDEYEVFARTETKYIEKNAPFVRPYLSISGGQHLVGGGFGLMFKQRVSIGARYLHIENKGQFAFEAGWIF